MTPHPLDHHPLRSLFSVTGARVRRASSWDRTGGNRDFLTIGPGETTTLMEHDGAGCITHFYCALALHEITDYRDAVIRMYWDGEDSPSVEVPLGDFFGIGHGRTRCLQSQMLVVNPGAGASHGLNSYFPMPFASGARVTLENRADKPLGGLRPAFWFHIEYEVHDAPPDQGILRFHAQWRQERPTNAVGLNINTTHHDAVNLDGEENYVALEATGAGQMVGLILQVNNVQGGWYGEGDDMVFIDEERWPPSIHGTGSEEIFGGGACPSHEYTGPYSGFHLIESPDFSGLISMYRWYLHDPIRFTRSIRWTIEHGHANNFANEYASVAYWYQTEPHAPFPALPDRERMRPFLGEGYEEAREAFFARMREGRLGFRQDPEGYRFLFQLGEAFYRGEWRRTLELLQSEQR